MVARAYWIVGPGRIGLSIGSVLADADSTEALIFLGRHRAPPDHPVLTVPVAQYRSEYPGPPQPRTRLLIAVPDAAIAAVAERIARLGPPGDECVALHFSGVQSADALAPLAELGYAVGSLHPLQAVADARQGAERLRAAFYTFEGDPAAREAAVEIVAAACGQLLEVHAADKARYHAACVFASNYVVACAAVATRILADAVDIAPQEAVRALQPLWRGAVANLAELGLPQALTGPIARGDVETVRRHLSSLDADTRRLYRQLAREALAVGRELGLDPRLAAALAREIDEGSGGTDPE